ncbi:hypothetical protein QTP88_015135 [Uroleucon formosanum]
MVLNVIKCLVNRGEDIFLQLKIYQIRRSIINSKVACSSINWYIVVFVVSSLMMKAVVGFEKWCLCNSHYSCPVVSDFVYASNFEEEIEEFLLCHFEVYWRHAYTTTSTIFDVLVIIAALNRNQLQLVYLWLFIKGMALIVKVSHIVKNLLISNEEISALQLGVLVDCDSNRIKMSGGLNPIIENPWQK